MKISYRKKIFIFMSILVLSLIIIELITAEITMRSSYKKSLLDRAELLANTFIESSLPFFLYYDWEELQRIAKNIRHSELVYLLVLDKENIVRVANQEKGLIGKKYLPHSSHEKFTSNPYYIYQNNKKISVIDAYIPVRVEGSSETWGTIVLTFSMEKMKKGLSRARISFITLGLLIIALGSFFNRWVSSLIAKPIKRLSGHLEEISKGNYEKRVPPIEMEEFEILIKSINSMAENLSRREKELREAKDFLEEKVKERTEELRRSEEKYRDFFERAGEAIFVINTSTMQIEEANEMAEKTLGYLEKLEGLPLSAFDSNGSLNEIINETIKNKSSYAKRLELKRLNGTTVPVEISTKLIGENLIHAIFRDITEKEKLEKLIIETERWRAMAELSEGFVHNFNNLLTIISGRARLIKEAVKDEKIIKGVETIEKMVREGVKITEKLLEFAQNREYEIAGQIIDINSLIEDVIELTSPKWKDMAKEEGKGIKIKTNFGDIPVLKGNKVELESAILNVLYNSIEAIEQDGIIEISTFFEEPNICIEIKDTGRGIEPENISKVFDPFFTTKGTIGTGFGLTISYNYIKKYGGNIIIESEKGKGTKVTIYLPIRR